MAKTVYMVADDTARGVFEDEDRRWWQASRGHVVVSPLDKANEYMSVNGGTLYRCEPMSADEEPAPEPRTVKAYVAFDPIDSVSQGLWALADPQKAKDRSRGKPIFEIEMREVAPPPDERETGWVVDGANGTLNGLYGPSGFGSARPFVFSTQSAANELAGMLCYGCTAIEVYRDTMDPVDDE